MRSFRSIVAGALIGLFMGLLVVGAVEPNIGIVDGHLSVTVQQVEAKAATMVGAVVRGGDGRTFRITYNSALSLHEAAVPNGFARPGDHMKIFYKKKTLKVHAIAGGCRCFDISDEGFNKLSDTSVGVIKARVKKL